MWSLIGWLAIKDIKESTHKHPTEAKEAIKTMTLIKHGIAAAQTINMRKDKGNQTKAGALSPIRSAKAEAEAPVETEIRDKKTQLSSTSVRSRGSTRHKRSVGHQARWIVQASHRPQIKTLKKERSGRKPDQD